MSYQHCIRFVRILNMLDLTTKITIIYSTIILYLMCSFVRNHVKLDVSLSWRWREVMVRVVVGEAAVVWDLVEFFFGEYRLHHKLELNN